MELNQFRDVDIVLDKANDNIIQKQFVSTGDKDGRSLTVQITDNGAIGEIIGATLNLYWHNQASGLTDLSAFYVVDRATSVFKIDYPQNMLTPGKVTAYIQILHGGKATHTKPFEITVQNLAGTTRGVLATAEYSALVTTLAQANEFEINIAKKADKTQVDALGNEIILARDGAQTLGERLDSDKAEVSAQLQQTEQKKADVSYVDSKTQGVSLAYKESYATVTDLQNEYPNGDVHNHVILSDNMIYTWANGTWTNTQIQANGTGIATKSIETDKLAFTVPSKNLLNKNDVVSGRYLNANGSLGTNASFDTSNFFEVLPNMNYYPYKIWAVGLYNSSEVFIKLADWVDDHIVTTADTALARVTIEKANRDVSQIEIGTKFTGYASYGQKIPTTELSGLQEITVDVPKKTVIIVAPSGGDFTTINTALNAIKDASEKNRYEIFVKIGTYHETFRTKHWVDIIGEDKYKTIIKYTGTIETWNNTSTIFAETNSKISNLTVEGTDTKYPMHIDKATGKWTLVVENVRMIHHGSLTDSAKAGTPCGVGLYPYQYLILKNCQMIDTKGAFGSSGVYVHNQYDSVGTGYRSIRIEECEISGVTYGIRPNDIESGGSLLQKNDAFFINNDITATHQEYYYPENSPAWHLFKKGNEYTQG